MSGSIEIVANSLKKSFDLRIWLTYLIISILSLFVFFAVIAVILLPSVAVYYIFGSDVVSIVLWTVLGMIGVILFLYIGAVAWAILLFVAKDFSEKEKISLNESWNNALARAPTLFFANTLLALFFGLLFLVLIWPSITQVAAAFSAVSYLDFATDPSTALNAFIAPLLQSLVTLFAMIIFFSIIAIVISPFSALVGPTVVFQNVSAYSGIKKAIVAAKENYWRNLIALILYAIVVFAIFAFFLVIEAGIDFISLFFSQSLQLAIIATIAGFVKFALNVFSQIIILSFVGIFSVNYYAANFFSEELKKSSGKAMLKEAIAEHKENGNEIRIPNEKETETVKLEPWMGKKI